MSENDFFKKQLQEGDEGLDIDQLDSPELTSIFAKQDQVKPGEAPRTADQLAIGYDRMPKQEVIDSHVSNLKIASGLEKIAPEGKLTEMKEIVALNQLTIEDLRLQLS